MLLHESGDQRLCHRLGDGCDPETRLFAIRNPQLPAGKAIGSLEDHTIAALYENHAAEEIGPRLWLNQPLDLASHGARHRDRIQGVRFRRPRAEDQSENSGHADSDAGGGTGFLLLRRALSKLCSPYP